MRRLPTWVRGLILLSVSVGLLALVTSRVDMHQVLDIFRQASVARLLGVLAFALSAFALLPTIRWRVTLRAMGYRMGLGELACARFGSQPLKVSIPFKGGEAFRAAWLRRVKGVPVLLGAASILFDMFLVGVAQLVFLCAGLALAGGTLNQALIPTGMLFGVVLLMSSRAVQELALKLAARIHQKLEDKLSQLAHGFLRFPPGTKVTLVLLSLLVEFSEVFSMYLCAHALSVDIPLASVLMNMPIVMGITLIPVTISGFGTREMAILLLFRDFGTPEELAGVALLFTTVEFIVPALVGTVFLSPFLAQLGRDPVPLLDPAETSQRG
jgi:uncharacterized protein (TIRG00374 family)